MAILKFRGIYLEDFERLEEKDPDTRYLVLNPDGSVYGEYIGDKLIEASEITARLEGEITRVEQELDTHIEDVDNPHEVTAEQVGTYAKLEIDNKDASTLQEAKSYADDRISEEVTAEKVKQLYEANPDTNAFTDAEKAKLAGIEEGAQVNTVNPEDLVAPNISFDGSDTNYLAGEANVEDAIKELDTRVKSNADSSAVEISKKLDKETYQAQEVRSRVNFRGGIGTEYITNPGSLVIDTHALFGVSADKYVFAGEYYEGLLPSDSARLATRKYVDDNVALKVSTSDIVDNLVSTATNKPLSAKQGKVLKDTVDALDARVDDLESEAGRLDNEIVRVEQKADAHIADVSNPHEVTAEQVGTYDKTAIDLKDADILQEAKAYTYSKVEIDNKDANVLQEAKDFTYSKSVIDAKDASTLQTAKDYTDNRISGEVTAEKVKQLYEANPNTNAFTDAEKAKLAGIEAGAEVNKVNSVNGKVGVVVLSQDDIGDGASYKRVSQAEKDIWNNKQDKLVAGNNITIDPSTNVISASGNAVGVIETRANVLTKIWTGTQAQYDAIETKDANTLYFII